MSIQMQDVRTTDMSPSDIKTAMQNKTLSICPYQSVDEKDLDQILNGFMHLGAIDFSAWRARCLLITGLGTGYNGKPLASIQINTETGTTHWTISPCTYCPQVWDCGKWNSYEAYSLLEDDTTWNNDLSSEEDVDD